MLQRAETFADQLTAQATDTGSILLPQHRDSWAGLRSGRLPIPEKVGRARSQGFHGMS